MDALVWLILGVAEEGIEQQRVGTRDKIGMYGHKNMPGYDRGNLFGV